MKKQKDKRNIVMIAASEQDANLYYATRFVAPDPIIFVQVRGKKFLIMIDLELGRAQEQASVDEVVSLSKLVASYRKKTGQRPTMAGLVSDFLAKKKVNEIEVPGNFPVEYADPLRRKKIKVRIGTEPFFEARVAKTKEEVKGVQTAIKHTQAAITAAINTIKKSVSKRGRLYYKGSLLTSEAIKKIINVHLMENDCIAQHSIVACGEHCVDPHNEGSGPLYANQSIIMDIFPRHSGSRYHADISRTVCKGKASKKLKEMYQAVLEGQEIAFKNIRHGVDGQTIHIAIQKRFEELGFETGVFNGRIQGFFHGTGHGLGLDVHEEPRISLGSSILEENHIVTVEPGLYYEGVGGVRIEDDVLVTKTGCKNLVTLPKILEI